VQKYFIDNNNCTVSFDAKIRTISATKTCPAVQNASCQSMHVSDELLQCLKFPENAM